MQTLELAKAGSTMDDLDHKIDRLSDYAQAEFKAVRAEIGGLREEMHAEFKAVRAEMKEEFAAVRLEMREEFRAVRAEIGSLRDTMETRFDALQHSILWLMGTMLVVVASILASSHL